MKKYRYILLFHLLLLYGIVFSQTEINTFRVIDSSSMKPIDQCYVLVKGKNISSISDEKGEINLKVAQNDTLVAYIIGYSLKKISVKDIRILDGIIYLNRKTLLLEEVTITDKKVITFKESDNSVILDFEFYDDYIISLANNGGKFNCLILLDINGNEVCKKQLIVKTNKLFKDCINNIHLLTDDSIYQIYYDYKQIKLLPPYHIRNFYRYLKPCECNFGEIYVFKEIRYQNQKNIYSYYDLKNHYSKNLSCIADSENIRNFNLDYNINYFLNLRRGGEAYLYSVTEIIKNIDKFREEMILDPYYEAMLKPVESEVKKVDTTFVLFNYTQKEAYYYSTSGILNKRVSLSGFSGIFPKLYIDYDTRNYIFTKRNQNTGLLTLYRFNNSNVTFSHYFLLKTFHYITNYKIKGNHLYFISTERRNNDFKPKIVKALIEWEKI